MEILTVAQMREIERHADAAGLSYAQMMWNAGSAAAQAIAGRIIGLPRDRPLRALVLCGPGNNGGDGLVCAAQLHDLSRSWAQPPIVQTYLLRRRPDDDPLLAPIRERGIFLADAERDLRLRALHQLVTHADVIVDALLGTGVSRPIEGDLRELLGELRAARARGGAPMLIALDGPTGMNYDTGALDPAAVACDLTITFHAPKRGHFCFPAAAACGEFVVAPIGVVPDTNQAPTLRLADDALVRAVLPARSVDGNKGSFGRALVVGGSANYLGAPALAAAAAYRVGAGLVTLQVPESILPGVAAQCPEATFVDEAGLAQNAVGLANVRAVLVGPGLGQHADSARRLAAAQEFAGAPGLPMVLDADALNLLAPMRALTQPAILTPHPGEMARLAGTTVAEIQADRIGEACARAAEWGAVVVLKGANSVVASPDGRAAVIPSANPAMATAGTGDVLAGAILGFLAQGLDMFEAALAGAYVHARAGEAWRAAHGDAGMLASDLLTPLPDAIRAIKTAPM